MNDTTAKHDAAAPRGVGLLHNSALTKSTAFTAEERERYGLRGLLPAAVGSMDTQLDRVLKNMRRKQTDIEKYIFLSALQDRNERLFYRLVIDNVSEIMPLIYTPTVGEACRKFANIFRTEKGFYVTAEDRGRIRELLDNWPHRDVRIIVITDGERILGLGDLGASGMGIPIGKLSLYCACAGIHPSQCLPVMFDVGTDNEEMRADPAYLGVQHARIRGEEYFELMDEFIRAAKDAYPGVLIQFEDFNTSNAFALLEKYQDNTFCFNDDIQGTAGVALAGVHASTRISGVDFADLRFAFLGAGSAAAGIGMMIAESLTEHGLSEEEANRRLWFFNRGGLVERSRENLPAYLAPFAHDLPPQSDFTAALEQHRPQVLIGATGMPATFGKDIIRLMARLSPRPTIFALSNPTARAECTAQQAYEWSGGKAIFASGSPFDPVELNGAVFHPGQGNNSYIFPGVGLGMIACRATSIPDSVFVQAARALAECISEEDLARGSLYPPQEKIREVSLAIATAVAEHAWEHGLASAPRPRDIAGAIRDMMYDPRY
ncbi:MAG: NAD-dependent malic enzyme [Gammaproteobacteria bacterium]|nr:NAD-dependent malic enzyme [Gammaproteobacteria bacterium]